MSLKIEYTLIPTDFEEKIVIEQINSNILPIECLSYIFTFCEPKDVVLSHQIVNKTWKMASDDEKAGLKVVKEIVSKVVSKLKQEKRVLIFPSSEFENHMGCQFRKFEKNLEINCLESDYQFPQINVTQEVKQNDRCAASSFPMIILLAVTSPLEVFGSCCLNRGGNESVQTCMGSFVDLILTKKSDELRCRIKGENYLIEKTTIKIMVKGTLNQNQQKAFDIARDVLDYLIIKK